MSELLANVVTSGAGGVGLVLLAINALGLFARRARGGRRREAAVRTASTPRGLLAALPDPDAAGAKTFCRRLAKVLQQRFGHGYARHTVWSNYACWLAGRFRPPFGEIHTTAALLRHSETALCSQIAQAFVDLATRAGVPARIVALDGHVVAEAYYEERWHGFDCDYGVPYQDPAGRSVSVEELAASPPWAARAYARHRLPRDNHEVLRILARGRRTYLPAGAHAVPRIARLQQALAWLKWLLPASLLLIWWSRQ